MPAPVVSWYSADNQNPISNWSIGVIDAGSVSPDTTFLIWNNRGGTADVSDMTNCTITTKDLGGNNNGDLITETWIEVRVDSMNETSFSPIGGTVTRLIRAGGAAPPDNGVIKGTANNGIAATAENSFAKVTLHANVPADATAGNASFLTRVAYQYV